MKRWLGLVAILVVAAAVLFVGFRLTAPHRQRAAFDQIQVGMSLDEVTRLMRGDPWREESLVPYGRQVWWINLSGRDSAYVIYLDDDDRVTWKGKYGE